MIDGLLVVDKPAGWTSHDVVARCRSIFHQKRIGHSGTLDPDATGLLLVGLGRVTRLLRFLTDLPKAYSGEVVLGVATSTLDASGEVTGRWDMSSVNLADVREAAAGLVGDILQVPPMVSAVKVGGRRLHALAREGTQVERSARPVTVHALDVEPAGEPGVFRIRVRCSSGTYVRSLAADIGAALGGGAHLRSLRRTAIGSFTLGEARPLDALGEADVLAPAEALRDYPKVVVDDEAGLAVASGKVLPAESLAVGGGGPWAVIGRDGALLAVYEPYESGTVKPAVVVAPA